MGIFDRFGKVISSNVNSLLDKAEDPRKSIDLMIEEMREQIRRGRQEVVSAIAAEKQLRQKVADLDAQIEKWQRRAELAVKAGDEKLAREALLLKKKLAGEREQAESLRAEQRGRALQMKEDMGRAEVKLKDLESRKGTIAARYQQARAGGGAEGLGASGDGPTPFDELRRIEGKMDQAEAEAEGMREARDIVAGRREGGLSPAELEARFSELEDGDAGADDKGASGDPDVDDELKALRRKLRVSS